MTTTPAPAPAIEPEREAHYAALRADLERAVRRVCPGWLKDREDDLVQVGILRVMHIETQGEGNRELQSSYLYRVAYSAMVDEIRRIRRRGETSLDTASTGNSNTETTAVHQPHRAITPEQQAQAAETGLAIRDCLQGLTASRRAAVTLYLAGHSVPESARILDWTLKKTENLVYRGLANLRKCLQSKGVRSG